LKGKKTAPVKAKRDTATKAKKDKSETVKKDVLVKTPKKEADKEVTKKNKKSEEPTNNQEQVDQDHESVKNQENVSTPVKKASTSTKTPVEVLKQQKQLELIDRFIDTKLDLNATKLESETSKDDLEDLSFHSTQFGDDLVTENLANIMIQQKNIETAIDIYKKLIWKFPQKKGYFATQIEKLQEQVNKGS